MVTLPSSTAEVRQLEDGPLPQVQLARKKKESFDIATEKETFFEARDVIGRNTGKSHVYEIPSTFDFLLEVGPSRNMVPCSASVSTIF